MKGGENATVSQNSLRETFSIGDGVRYKAHICISASGGLEP